MTNHPNRGALPRPSLMLREIARRYPDAWRIIDRFRRDRGKYDLPDWPEWCYCPMSAAYAIVSGGGSLDDHLGAIGDVQAVAALSAWRATQGIYRFDPALAAAIKPTPITALPVDVLYRLPEWCVYVEEAHELGCGFFAHLEWDANTGRPELRLLLDIPDQPPQGLSLHLDQPTLDASVAAMVAESRRQMVRIGQTHREATVPGGVVDELAASVTPLLNLVLYLCSEAADFGGERPMIPKPVRTKRGWRLFPPDKPRVWEIGARIGAALRSAHLAEQTGRAQEAMDGRQSPRPHVRRAHWHTYRVGAGRTDTTLKWLPPIPINIDNGEIIPTIHEVRK